MIIVLQLKNIAFIGQLTGEVLTVKATKQLPLVNAVQIIAKINQSSAYLPMHLEYLC